MNFSKTKMWFGLAAASLLFSADGQNLIENGDFENGISECVPPSRKRPRFFSLIELLVK